MRSYQAAAAGVTLLATLVVGVAIATPDGLGPDLADPGAAVTVSGAYDRSDYPHWTDPDENGCDARNDALGLDLVRESVRRGPDGCKVAAGVLFDPYTGERIQFRPGMGTNVQIDHVIPLAYADRHGARPWPEIRKEDFANDQANLVATGSRVNNEKSDQGPSQWMPPNPAFRCSYLAMWSQLAEKYQIRLDSRDAAAVANGLETCP